MTSDLHSSHDSAEWPPFLTTRDDLIRAFSALGVTHGMCIMIHASLRSLGHVVNGANDVIDAIQDVVGGKGTILASANSSQLTDPAEWQAPPVPKEWTEEIRQNMAPFDARLTPIRGRGILPSTLMMYNGVCRSCHPVKSIAALGHHAEYITSQHPLHESEGVGSPLHKLCELGGYALMIGVDLSSCSALHVAEFVADVPYLYEGNFKALVETEDGTAEFVRLRKYPKTSKHFPKLERVLSDCGALSDIWYREKCRLILVNVSKAVNVTAAVLRENPMFLLREA